EDRLVCPLQRLVLLDGQGYPLQAVLVTALTQERPTLTVARGQVEALDRHPHLAVQLFPRRRALASLVRQRTLPGRVDHGKDTPGRRTWPTAPGAAPGSGLEEVVPVDNLGHANWLVAVLALDRGRHRRLATPVLLLHRVDAERAAHARAGGNR